MRTAGVVVPPPAFDDDLGLRQRVEDLAVEQLVAELAVEALAVAVLPGAAGLDVGRRGTDRRDPGPHGLGDELGPVVGADVARDAAQDEQVREQVDDVDRVQLPAHPDRQALAGELVDDVEQAVLAPVPPRAIRPSARRDGSPAAGGRWVRSSTQSWDQTWFGCA